MLFGEVHLVLLRVFSVAVVDKLQLLRCILLIVYCIYQRQGASRYQSAKLPSEYIVNQFHLNVALV